MGKLPSKAKNVFNGIVFDVYQWQQKMFDGSYQTFEMLKRHYTILILAVQGKKILFAHEEQPGKKPAYCLFGGRQEQGEKPLSTGKRELLEESGYTSIDWTLFKIYEPHSSIDWKIYFYIARNCKKTGTQKLDAGEKITIKSLSFEKFLKLVDSQKFSDKIIQNDLFRIQKNSQQLNAFKKKIFSG